MIYKTYIIKFKINEVIRTEQVYANSFSSAMSNFHEIYRHGNYEILSVNQQELELSKFLDFFDYNFEIKKDNKNRTYIELMCKQNADLGNISKDKFYIDEDYINQIIQRLDTYIQEKLIQNMIDILAEGYNIEISEDEKISLESVYSIYKATADTHIIAECIIDPKKIILDKK